MALRVEVALGLVAEVRSIEAVARWAEGCSAANGFGGSMLGDGTAW